MSTPRLIRFYIKLGEKMKLREFWIIGDKVYDCEQLRYPTNIEQIHVREVLQIEPKIIQSHTTLILNKTMCEPGRNTIIKNNE